MSDNNIITIYVLRHDLNCLDSYLIFDHDTVNKLRNNPYRICGRLIGTITNVSKQTLNTNAYLPVKLNRFEFELISQLALNDKSIQIKQKNYDSVDNKLKINQLNTEYNNYLEKIKQIKQNEYVRVRKEQLIALKDKIIDGKRKKLNIQLQNLTHNEQDRLKITSQLNSLETDFEDDLNQVQVNLDTNSLNTEIFTQTPEFYNVLFNYDLINRSIIIETCKFKCFKHFWSMGYYLTCGAKFGGDFLG